MNKSDPREVVTQFNQCINNRDITGLSKLMSENHLFIDSENNRQSGKDEMLKAWKDFFDQFPDYKNHFSRIELKKDRVVITGHSSCSFKPLDGPAIWTAVVKDGLVEEWRVYDDTDENRDELGLEAG